MVTILAGRELEVRVGSLSGVTQLNVADAIANRDSSAAELAIRSYVLQRQKDMRLLM